MLNDGHMEKSNRLKWFPKWCIHCHISKSTHGASIPTESLINYWLTAFHQCPWTNLTNSLTWLFESCGCDFLSKRYVALVFWNCSMVGTSYVWPRFWLGSRRACVAAKILVTKLKTWEIFDHIRQWVRRGSSLWPSTHIQTLGLVFLN